MSQANLKLVSPSIQNTAAIFTHTTKIYHQINDDGDLKGFGQINDDDDLKGFGEEKSWDEMLGASPHLQIPSKNKQNSRQSIYRIYSGSLSM